LIPYYFVFSRRFGGFVIFPYRESIHVYSNKYLTVYKHGATGVFADLAVHKFALHHGVMKKDIEDAQAAWEVKKAKLERPQSKRSTLNLADLTAIWQL
jgi:hypothetical protein